MSISVTLPELRDRILNIYDAVADSSLWPDILQRFADDINAVGCIIFEWEKTPNGRILTAPLASRFYDLAQIERYVAEYLAYESRDQDVFEAHSLRADGIDLIEDHVLAPGIEELRQLPNVVILQKLGILHRAAGLLNKDNRSISRFSIQLGVDRGRLSPIEKGYISTVLPHMAKALDLGRPAQQLAGIHRSLLAAMDRLTIGVCLLDPKGRIAESNAEFNRQKEKYSIFETDFNSALRFRDPLDQERFARLKQDALNHGRFGARPRKEAVSAGDTTYLCIEVTPLRHSQELGSKNFDGFILYSTDTSLLSELDARPMERAFGLTKAELALADLIGQGLTNAQIAERRERSVATINTQVKSIMAKTNCSTRTQFLRLMMSFGANYLSP